VSKFHASIYWDSLRREWGIVDMGSMHGTFVRSARDPSTSTAGSEPSLGTRLSDTRKSSMPRVLRHLDEITIGGSVFLVHEHLTGRPCEDCAIDGPEEIPLLSSHGSAGKHPPHGEQESRKRKRGNEPGEKDPRKAMAQLKNSLMTRHTSSSSPSLSNASYKDRSALRREFHPEPRVPSLPAPSHLGVDRSPAPTPRVVSPPPLPPPPVPLPSTNIGHKLLLLQGWNPGTALGENPEEGGLVEPISVSVNTSRAGLGSSVPRPANQLPGDWREEAKRRRWDGVRPI